MDRETLTHSSAVQLRIICISRGKIEGCPTSTKPTPEAVSTPTVRLPLRLLQSIYACKREQLSAQVGFSVVHFKSSQK